jgi:phosphatidylserine/phosphatidylglycerophosphate/cardiolipin synthase-like enzyme
MVRDRPSSRRTPFRSRRFLLLLSLLLAVGAAAWIAWTRQRDQLVDVGGDAGSATIGRVHFGGPDQPAGRLRTLLLERVRAAPKGSSIDWATYLFIDRELAEALIAASDRGVRVTLCLDGDPRLRGANDATISKLKRHGLRNGLTVRARGWQPMTLIGGLHSKIYVFSHPRPLALVGSFNPSRGATADARLLRENGDHDRGHNLLVEITSAGLVGTLRDHVRALSRTGGTLSPLSAAQNRVYVDRDTQLYFYPRLRPTVVEAHLNRLGRGDRVWGAISHFSKVPLGAWTAASKRGAKLNLIVHHDERRVPPQVVDRLTRAGIVIRRYRHSERLPMHAKFLLVHGAGERVSYFGSFNFNLTSRHFNQEVLVRSTNPELFKTLLLRFAQLQEEVRRQARGKKRSSSSLSGGKA